MRAADAVAAGSVDDDDDDDDGVDAPLTPLIPKPLTPPVGVGSGEEDDDDDDDEKRGCRGRNFDDGGLDTMVLESEVCVNCGENADTSSRRFNDSNKATSCITETQTIIAIAPIVVVIGDDDDDSDDCFTTVFMMFFLIMILTDFVIVSSAFVWHVDECQVAGGNEHDRRRTELSVCCFCWSVLEGGERKKEKRRLLPSHYVCMSVVAE